MAVWDVEAAVHAACLWTLGNLLLRGQSGSTRSAISDISTFEVCIWKCISDDNDPDRDIGDDVCPFDIIYDQSDADDAYSTCKGGGCMNFLRLCRYLYTKRLANEIILLIQLVCMIELSFVVLNPVDSFLADRANVTQAYTIDFNEVIHFSENNAMMSADIRGQEMPIDIIYQRIKETDGVKNILCFGFCNGLYTYRNPEVEENEQSNANLIVYSEEMMDAISLQLKEGEKKQAADGRMPILVSESLENELPVGTVTEIEIYKNQKKLVCEVMGVLDHDSAIPVVMNYADVPELGHLAVFPEEIGRAHV